MRPIDGLHQCLQSPKLDSEDGRSASNAGQTGRHAGGKLHDCLRAHDRPVCLYRRRAVVTKDVPDHALVLRTPARVVDWMCQCGVKLKTKGVKLDCPQCGRHYRKDDGGLIPLTIPVDPMVKSVA